MARRRRNYDIIIVGGGMCGAAMALELQALGLNIAMIECQPPQARPGLPERVIALSHGSRCHLDALGVWPDIRAQRAAPIRQVFVCEVDNRGMVQLHHRQAHVDALGYVVENAHILSAMRAHLKENVDTYCPASVQEIGLADDVMHVHIRDAGGEKHLKCALLVGADGTNSQIRRMAGIGTLGWDHNRFGIVASVTPAKPHAYIAYECFRTSGPLALLPLDEERFSIVWTQTPEEAARCLVMPDTVFLRSLNRAMGERLRAKCGGIVKTGPRACFPFELRQATARTAARLALIGNAVHTLHPVAGQGLNLGLRDVRALGGAVRAAVEGGRDVGGRIVLETYADARCMDNAAVVAFTEGLNAVFNNDLAPVRFVRGWGLQVMQRLPIARNWLMRHAAGLSQMQGQGT